jgi:carbon storage regulator
MLVLSRKRNEKIVIGEGESKVVITIVEVRGDKVRIGIEANPVVPVHREEVYNVICEEKENGTKNLLSLSKEDTA